MNAAPDVALVTGASRGIGRATALAFSARGLELVLIGRASAELESAERDCLAAGARAARIIPVDLSDPAQIEGAAAALTELFPAVSIVVHNAGVVRRGRVHELPIGAWREQLEVNLTAPFVLTRALLPGMLAAKRGRILFVASISSTLGTSAQSAYAASKWGIVGFMKSLAEELSDSGLMTAAVLPGSVATQMLEGSGFPARMQPEDVARTLTFLALDAPLSHNGACVEMFGT